MKNIVILIFITLNILRAQINQQSLNKILNSGKVQESDIERLLKSNDINLEKIDDINLEKIEKEDDKFQEKIKEDIRTINTNDISNTSIFKKDAKSNENSAELKNKVIAENDKKNQLEYFGYDMFNVNPDLFQKSSLEHIDPDYIISPGDEIIILIWSKLKCARLML